MTHDFNQQNELHKKIRNDEDYDDWEYGTEPLIGSPPEGESAEKDWETPLESPTRGFFLSIGGNTHIYKY